VLVTSDARPRKLECVKSDVECVLRVLQ